jgi:hypothetical protein
MDSDFFKDKKTKDIDLIFLEPENNLPARLLYTFGNCREAMQLILDSCTCMSTKHHQFLRKNLEKYTGFVETPR